MTKAVSLTKRALVFQKTQGLCFYCGEIAVTLDHVKSKKSGGSREVGNLLPSCVRCNSRKGSKTIEAYRRYLTPTAQAAAALDSWLANFASLIADSQQNELRKTLIALCRAPLVKFYGETINDEHSSDCLGI